MRALIVSDVHSNLEAFRAVLQDAEEHGGFDEVWCLGDLLGYGPNPRECMDLLRQHPYLWIAGNHDWAAAGKIDTSRFNPYAEAAAKWTQEQLTKEDRQLIEDLPLKEQKGDLTLAHGSPRDPIWEYLLSEGAAMANLEHFNTPFCLVGHSHIPFICDMDEVNMHCEFKRLPAAVPVELGKGRLIINPGGLGQPRDRDPRSPYAIYDGERNTVIHYRVKYDIPAVQEKMKKAGLPEKLITRLSHGI